MATRTHHTARRSRRAGAPSAVLAVSSLAAVALLTAACGESGTAEKAVGGATSAVGSAATQATSAIGDATDGNGKDGTAEDGTGQDGTGQNSTGQNSEQPQNPDQEFLRDIRRVGVDTPDEQDYLTRGRNACASLDGGTGYIDVLKQYNDAHPEAPVTEGPVVVTAAVKAFCSQHAPQIGQNEGGGQGGEG